MKLNWIFLIAFCLNGHAYELDKRLPVKYTESIVTFNEIANKHFEKYKFKYRNIEEYISDLKQWNPHLKDLTDIPEGTAYYDDYPYLPHIDYKWAEKIDMNSIESKKSVYLSFIYSVSQSQFIETFNNGVKANFQQNSPATIGLMGRKVMTPESSFSGSLYISQLNPSTTNQESKISVPPEVGFNSYYEKSIFSELYLYGGLDYEKFYTINSQVLDQESKIVLAANQIMYGNIGLSFYKRLSNKSLVISKLSYAKTFASSIETGKEYSGNRIVMFLGYNTNSRLTYSLLYKIHNLTAEDKTLSSTRIGIGLGYSFF